MEKNYQLSCPSYSKMGELSEFSPLNNLLSLFWDNPLKTLVNMDQLSDIFPVNVESTEDAYLLSAEMPGIKKEDLQITFNENTLTLSYNKTEKKEDEGKNYILKECESKKGERKFIFKNVKVEEITASIENGILKIKLPKDKEAKKPGKEIEIT